MYRSRKIGGASPSNLADFPWVAGDETFAHLDSSKWLHQQGLDAKAVFRELRRLDVEETDGLLVLDHRGAVLLNSADAVIVTDPDGLITTANPSFIKLVGAEESDVVGHPLRSFVDDAGQETSEEGESGPTPVTVLTKSGTEFVMPAAHFPIYKDKAKSTLSGYLTIVYVIQANSLQQAQTEFVSTVSHELRTPLTSIKGFADTILRAGERLDISQQRRYVGIIKDQADRLTRLVEDLLAVSRLESKKLQLTIRAIDLREAIERVTQNLADKAQKHSIIMQVPAGLTPVWADADRLEQILTNLIDNAIKYSMAGTTVTITAKGIQGTPEMVEFAVADQGGGREEEAGQVEQGQTQAEILVVLRARAGVDRRQGRRCTARADRHAL